MPGVCIVTDSTAQFTQPKFPGHDRVFVLPLELKPVFEREAAPLLAGHKRAAYLSAPDRQNFVELYTRLGARYDGILVLLHSAALSQTVSAAGDAAGKSVNPASIRILDSGSVATGLGLLVQEAAAAAAGGASLADVERLVRTSIPNIFMLFCIPQVTCLYESGLLEYSQAVVAEMLGILPVFSMEEGRLIPFEKVRTNRHLIESFQEFVDEFDDPKHVILMRGNGNTALRTRPLREYILERFPETIFSELIFGRPLLAMFGTHSLGLVIQDRNGTGAK